MSDCGADRATAPSLGLALRAGTDWQPDKRSALWTTVRGIDRDAEVQRNDVQIAMVKLTSITLKPCVAKLQG